MEPFPLVHKRRFLFVTGKGGAGKTTVCAALATALAESGQRVLVATSGAEERLSAVLDTAPIGGQVVEVRRNLFSVFITPREAMSQYGAMILRSRLAYTPLFENKYVTNFFEAVPGLREWAVLGRSWYLANETLPNGSRRFDVVLLDAPATGHALDMLAVPKVIIDVAPSGALRRDAEHAWQMLHDPEQSGIVVVTLPEELPLTETMELEQKLKESFRLPISGLVVNGCRVPLLSKEEAELLQRRAELLVPTRSLTLAQLAARRAMRERVQARNLARLDNSPQPKVLLPLLSGSDSTGGRIAVLSRYFSGDSAKLRVRFG